jgi:hypothetical protein
VRAHARQRQRGVSKPPAAAPRLIVIRRKRGSATHQQRSYGYSPADYDHTRAAPPRKRRRVFLWVFLAIQPCSYLAYRGNRVLRAAFPPTATRGTTGNNCHYIGVQGRTSASAAGTGIGAALIIILWMVVEVILGVSCRIRRSGRAKKTWRSAAGAGSRPGGRRSESSLIKPVPGRAGGRNDNTGASPTVPGGSRGRLRPGAAHRCPVVRHNCPSDS